MKALIRFFAQRATFANVFSLSLMLLGINALGVIQRDNFPNVDFNEMTVTTRYPGAAPEDVELHVTNEIEDALKEVDDLDTVTSYSMENISIVHIRLDDNARDIGKVKTNVRDAVSSVTDLPPEVDERPRVMEITTSTGIPIIEVGLSGDVAYAELRAAARQTEKALKKIAGVASVTRYGYLDREIKVQVDQTALERYQLSTADIVDAIRNRNIRATGGSFESYTDEKNIVTLSQFKQPLDVADAIVSASSDGAPIRVRDLAEVTDEFEPEKVRSHMNGQPAIAFLVFKTESADLVRTIDRIHDYVAGARERLPAGIALDTSNDKSRIVKNRLQVVANNGLFGLALVLGTLTLFLNLRTAFWVAMGIPIALLGTLFLLPWFGAFMDSIALSAMILVIGIIVDDGIVIGESIWRQRELGVPPLEAAVEGTAAVILPVLTNIVTTLLAFSPMFFIPGAMSGFVFVIPLVVFIALLISLVEVVTALPAHLIAGKGARSVAPRPEHRLIAGLRRRFRRALEGAIHRRYGLIAAMLALLAGTLWYARGHLEFALFPTQSADELYVTVELPSGTSLQRTSEKVREIEALVEQLPAGELDSFVTRIGNHGAYNIGENENWANIGVYLTPFSTRERNADEIVEDLRQRIRALEGIVAFNFIIDSGGPPVGRPITLRVVGGADDDRAALADEVVRRLGQIDGVKDIDRNDKRGKEQILIDLDYLRLADFGLSVADVANAVRIAYDGEVVTAVRYGDEDVEFRVQLEKAARSSLDMLARLSIRNRDGQFIQLREFARFVTGPGPSHIYHYENERAITLTADVNKDVVTPMAVSERIAAAFELERDWPGLELLVGGEAEETVASVNNLLVAFYSAMLAVYVVLLLLFNSLLQPVLVMLAIPFGLIGVFMAFIAHGQPMGFLGMMGALGMIGIVINDSLILVNLVNELQRQQPDRPVREAVIDATEARLRAILLTSITTVAGLIPMAYGIGGFDPYAAPMALAMGYGILLATPLTLFLLPCFLVAAAEGRSALQRLLRRHPADPGDAAPLR